MALTCNIDSRGKRIRLINGIIGCVIGLILLFVWAIPTGSRWAWIVTAVLLIGGGFCIFEARAGWCVVRAMGFKTKI